MRRFWIGVLAAVGLLAHAAAIVRHSDMMLARALHGGGHTIDRVAGDRAVGARDAALDAFRLAWAAAGITADAGAICQSPSPDGVPGGAGNQSTCPICAGLAGLFAPPTTERIVVRLAEARPPTLGFEVVRVPRQVRFLRPLSRGPPLPA